MVDRTTIRQTASVMAINRDDLDHGTSTVSDLLITVQRDGGLGDGGGGHWLVRMEWRSAGWSMCLPLLIFPCTVKSRSSLLAPAHPGGPGKRAIKWLWWCGYYSAEGI